MTFLELNKSNGKNAVRNSWWQKMKSLISRDIEKELFEKNKELNKFRLVLEQAPGAVYIIDKYMNFEYINPHFTQLSGYTKDELLHKNIQETLYKGKIPESRSDVIETLSKGEKWQGELLTYHKSGSTYWANTIAAPYKDDNGNVEGFIVIQQDISNRKKLEIALQESEKLYRTLIEKSLDGVSLTQNGRIILTNQAFCDMFGYSMEEVGQIGANELIAPEDRERVTGIHYQRMRGEIDTLNYSATFLHKSGKKMKIELKSTTVQVNGQNASFITMRDITEKQALQEALEQSVQKFRDLAEMLPQTVYELDLQGNQTYINKAGIEAFRYQSSAIGRSAFDFIIPEDHARMRENMQKSIQDKNFSSGNEYTAVRDDGTRFPVIVYAAPIVNKEIATGTRGIIVDISERKAMENALRENESKYKTLVENSQDGITIIRDNKILFANNTYCKMLNYTTEELYAMPAVTTLHPSEHEKAFKIAERRKNRDFSTINEVLLMVTKDGEIKECETSSTLIEYEGQWASFFTSHDITQSKRIQLELKESEEKYRQLVELTNSIILKWDKNFNITFLNEYGLQFFGYSKEEIISKPMVGTIIPYSEEYTGRNLAILMEEIYKTPEKYAQNINENMRKNGERVWMSWNNTAIRNEKGEIINMFSIGADITERKKNEEELQVTKDKLQKLNLTLEKKVKETAEKLTEVNTQLINLQKENLQSQFDVLKQQVNPHFLFNSLNVLTSLIKLEPDLAEKFSEHLSKVYRYVLENKDNELVDLNTELNFLDAYIFLLNIRFVNKLRVNINIPEARRNDQIIPLAMQLLIENAIKHNIMSKSEPLTIDIFIDSENYLNIINNLQERPSQLISTGVGLKNIQNRYLLLNNTAPIFEKTETHFIAKVPLVGMGN